MIQTTHTNSLLKVKNIRDYASLFYTLLTNDKARTIKDPRSS